MKNTKLLSLISLLAFSQFIFAQSADLPPKAKPGVCYAKCLVGGDKEEGYLTKIEEYPVYIGERPSKVKVKTVKVEVLPAEKEWVKKKSTRNCLSEDPNDCLVWCLVDVHAAEYKELEVLKKPHKLDDDEWEYEQVEIKYKSPKAVGGGTVWMEVKCEGQVNAKFVNDLNERLKLKGFDSGSTSKIMDAKIKSALAQFQRKNSLPVGQLDFETLGALGLK